MAYTNIDDPSAYFQTILWTGNSTDSRALTNDGNSDLQPDWVWLKNRDLGYNHFLQDSSRGNTKVLNSDSTAAESTFTNMVESFDTNGFTVGFDGSQVPNFNGNTFVGWQWKANGGTTSSNTDGTVTTTTQVNSDAGFSIVTWAGGGTGTLGHGLGVTPDMWIIKNRDYAVSWTVGFSDSNMIGGRSKYLLLNSTSAISSYNNLWGTSDAQISSTTIGAAGDRSINISGDDYVGYFFKAKQGYSKFGKYVGNGSNTDGSFIYTGFRPAMIIAKRTDASAHNWFIWDTKRAPSNLVQAVLYADATSAEGSLFQIDILSNGFKHYNNYGSTNVSGGTYIYMAFAENPFVTSTGIPTTAR